MMFLGDTTLPLIVIVVALTAPDGVVDGLEGEEGLELELDDELPQAAAATAAARRRRSFMPTLDLKTRPALHRQYGYPPDPGVPGSPVVAMLMLPNIVVG